MEVTEATLVGRPALDILVPTHNRIDLTMKCLEAIYFHTRTPFHVIVVDDSTDNLTPLYFKQLVTEGVAPIGKVQNLTFIHSEVPYRTGNQFFNLGFRYSKSEYIATVMNSVSVEPDWETYALNELMLKNPDVGIIVFKCLFAGLTNKVGHIESAGIQMVKYIPSDMGRDLPGHRLNNVYEVNAGQWAFALLRRRAVVGVLDDFLFHGFKGWDDIDNCFVVKSKGWKMLYCGLGIGYHEPRATRGNNSQVAEEENRENGERFFKRWGLWEMFLADHPDGKDMHKMPKENEQFHELMERTAFQPVREEVAA